MKPIRWTNHVGNDKHELIVPLIFCLAHAQTIQINSNVSVLV